jgi:hypothetical protein
MHWSNRPVWRILPGMSENRAKLWAEFMNGVGLVTASALLIATVLVLARIFHVYQPPG